MTQNPNILLILIDQHRQEAKMGTCAIEWQRQAIQKGNSKITLTKID